MIFEPMLCAIRIACLPLRRILRRIQGSAMHIPASAATTPASAPKIKAGIALVLETINSPRFLVRAKGRALCTPPQEDRYALAAQ